MKLETFLLERWMTRHELHVDFDICESGIYPLTVDEVLSMSGRQEREQLLARLLDIRLGYSEASGTLELRSLLAATYADSSPDEILITTGAIEANYLVLNTLLEAGNHVVAVYPAYQQLHSVPRALGCDVEAWKLRPENDFRYDLDELETLVRPDTALIIINTPHNPTGAILSASELQQIVDLADSVDAHVLGDEAYRWLEIPGGESIAPPVRDLSSRAISVGTFSKPFGLPGLRIGWIAGPKDLVAQCWLMRDYISLSPGKINDFLATVALRNLDTIQERTRKIVEQNLRTAREWSAEHQEVVSWEPPRGGLLSLMKYGMDIPSDTLADRLAEEYSVMLAPGSAFGYEGYLRLGIGANPPVFAAGLERTSACFRDLQAIGTQARFE